MAGYVACMQRFYFHTGIPSECQLVWITMSGLICVQTVLQRLSADETKELNKQSNNVRVSKYKVYSKPPAFFVLTK